MTKLHTLDLSLGFHASENIVTLARVFRALSYCREDLIQYYDDVNKSKFPKLSCLFPNPTPINTKTLPNLTYQKCLARNGQPTSDLVDLGKATTAMFTAIPISQSMLSSSSPPVITNQRITFFLVLAWLQNSTSVSVSLAIYSWSLWTLFMESQFGSFVTIKHKFPQRYLSLSGKPCISFTQKTCFWRPAGQPYSVRRIQKPCLSR